MADRGQPTHEYEIDTAIRKQSNDRCKIRRDWLNLLPHAGFSIRV